MTQHKQIERQADCIQPAFVGSGPDTAAGQLGGTTIPNRPFPVDALPSSVQSIVSEAARAIGCDPAAVAVPAISGLGVAIGNTRVLLAKKGWRVPPIVWGILAMPSGSRKSPALDITADYFRERQAKLQGEYRKRIATENTKPPKDREAINPNVVWVDDPTTEALADAMETNPRGVLLASDELGRWLGGMGIYKRNGAIADVSRYCQWYGGRGAMILRKDRDRPVTFAKGTLAITGALTLSSLHDLADRTVQESGLLARMLPCCPPVSPRRWTDDTITTKTTQAFHSLLDRLFQLEGGPGGPQEIDLGAEAKRLWQAYFDSHNKEAESLSCDKLRAAWSKLEELPCRLALILHECEGGRREVSLDAMERAIALAEWFKHETRRVYVMLFGHPKTPAAVSNASRVVAWMDERGWVTEREICRHVTAFRGEGGTDAARAVLKELVAHGLVESEAQPVGNRGGHPTMKYRCVTEPRLPAPAMADTAQDNATSVTQPRPTATQPRQSRGRQGCVTVTTVTQAKTSPMEDDPIAAFPPMTEPEPQPPTLLDDPNVVAVPSVSQRKQWIRV